MVTVRLETFQNIGFIVGMAGKNDPLNISIFKFELIFLKEVRSSVFQETFVKLLTKYE